MFGTCKCTTNTKEDVEYTNIYCVPSINGWLTVMITSLKLFVEKYKFDKIKRTQNFHPLPGETRHHVRDYS